MICLSSLSLLIHRFYDGQVLVKNGTHTCDVPHNKLRPMNCRTATLKSLGNGVTRVDMLL